MKALLLVIFSLMLTSPVYAFQFHNIKRVNNSVGSGLDYNVYNNHDFNGDGAKDKVRCHPDKYLEIRNGKTNKVFFSWNGPTRFVKDNDIWSRRRVFSGCEVVGMPGGKPVVLISNFWDTFKYGKPFWRARSAQYIAYHNGRRYIVRALRYADNKVYYGVSRSVKCHAFPNKLVKKGYKRGLLCFYADYASDNYNRTALFKIEQSKDKKTILAKDVTASLVGTPWRNGANGTNIYTMPLGRGWASNQRDGAFMMDSSFFNFQKDGLVDLMTIGQHARVRAHRMIYDPRYKEGFRYVTTNLTDAAKGTSPTEFIKIRSTKRFGGKMNTPCAYLSSESGKVERDHFQCFMDNRWVKFNLPRKFNSVYRNAVMSYHSKLGIIIKTGFRNAKNEIVNLTFRVPLGKTIVPEVVIPSCPYGQIWNGSSCVYDVVTYGGP